MLEEKATEVIKSMEELKDEALSAIDIKEVIDDKLNLSAIRSTVKFINLYEKYMIEQAITLDRIIKQLNRLVEKD